MILLFSLLSMDRQALSVEKTINGGSVAPLMYRCLQNWVSDILPVYGNTRYSKGFLF